MARVVTVKLKDSIVELVDEVARASGLTRSEIIRRALLFCLNTEECLKGLKAPKRLMAQQEPRGRGG